MIYIHDLFSTSQSGGGPLCFYVGGGQLVWWDAGREEDVVLEALERVALTRIT
jgi:hypothetical protein